jgi:endo-1,4-beta-xylanase
MNLLVTLALLCVANTIVLGAVVLPSTWTWTSSNILVDVKSDSTHSVQSIKDPTIAYYNNHYHVYATIHTPSGYSMVYLNFTDFSNANTAPWYYMDRTPGFTGYKCAPELFYFEPHKLWYLVFQSPYPTYSTNPNPGNPSAWSNPRTMFTNMPNNGIDFFTICDNNTCYLFFSDDNGSWYRTSTSKSNFPNGWGGFTTVLKSSNKVTYFEASWVYKLTTQDEYFAGIEGIGSDGTRYYQTFTASSLSGSWTELTSNFASHNNVQYPSQWNNGISHGELIRAGYNEFLELNPCGIKFLYQGVSASSHAPYDELPYKLGLLTSTNKVSGC